MIAVCPAGDRVPGAPGGGSGICVDGASEEGDQSVDGGRRLRRVRGPSAVVDTYSGEGKTCPSGEGVLHVVEPEW